nr:hypothetical protein RVX_2300 [Nitratidesulfovibrio sp. HK-II]
MPPFLPPVLSPIGAFAPAFFARPAATPFGAAAPAVVGAGILAFACPAALAGSRTARAATGALVASGRRPGGPPALAVAGPGAGTVVACIVVAGIAPRVIARDGAPDGVLLRHGSLSPGRAQVDGLRLMGGMR